VRHVVSPYFVRVYRCVRGCSHHSLFWTQPCQSTAVLARERPANVSNHPHNVREEPSSLTPSGSPSHRRHCVAAVGFRANEEEEGFSSKIGDLLDIGQSTKSGFVKRWVPCPPLWVGMMEGRRQDWLTCPPNPVAWHPDGRGHPLCAVWSDPALCIFSFFPFFSLTSPDRAEYFYSIFL
jgi:hypothetical protein